jgi:hypothetical protein
MVDRQHTRTRRNHSHAGPPIVVGVALALVSLIFGGCVAAGPSNGVLPSPSATGVPSVPGSVAPPAGSASPGPSASGGPFATTAPCLSTTSPAQACSSEPAAPSPAGSAIPPRTAPAASAPSVTRVPAPNPAGTPVARTAPTPSPADAAASSVTVTQVDDGTVLNLAVGQQFLLDLGASMSWAVTVADQNVVGRVPGILVIQGAQGVYVARTAGTTVLNAVGSPHCTAGACPLFRLAFSITIKVI